MAASSEREEETSLPWDPLWAYVLGEDEEDRDQVLDDIDFHHPDESRDTGDGVGRSNASIAPAAGGGVRALWQRLKCETVTRESREDDQRDTWQWELDTSSFLLASSPSEDGNRRTGEQSNAKKDNNKKSDQPSWIGAVRKAALPKSLLRKPT